MLDSNLELCVLMRWVLKVSKPQPLGSKTKASQTTGQIPYPFQFLPLTNTCNRFSPFRALALYNTQGKRNDLGSGILAVPSALLCFPEPPHSSHSQLCSSLVRPSLYLLIQCQVTTAPALLTTLLLNLLLIMLSLIFTT